MAFCIILDVDFAVVSDVLPPFVLRLTSYIDVRCVKPALVLFPFQRMVQRTHNCTRVLFLFRRCSSFPPPISYCFSIFSGSAAHAFVCFSVFRSVAMAQHRAQTAVCCVRAHTSMDLHFLLSWIFAFRRIQKERERKNIYIICLCFCLGSLITFRLPSENTILCLRSSFHLKLHFFFLLHSWLSVVVGDVVGAFGGGQPRHRGNATNKRINSNVSNWARTRSQQQR